MKRFLLMVPVVLAAAATLTAADRRELSETIDVNIEQAVRLEFPTGELHIEAGVGDKLTVEVTARCRWEGRDCDQALDGVEIRSSAGAQRVVVEVLSPKSFAGAKLDLDAVVRLPQTRSLDVDMGVGEVSVEGFAGDLTVDLGVGEAKVWVLETAVKTVSMDAGVGEAEIFGGEGHVAGRRSMLVGSEIYWSEGKGDARVTVDVGVGHAAVWLERR